MGRRRPATPLASDLTGTLHGARPVSEVDLHGHTQDQAVRRARDFLHEWSQRAPGAVVRIITGRGNNSQDGPVLLDATRLLLQREQKAGLVQEWTRDAGGGGWLARLRGG